MARTHGKAGTRLYKVWSEMKRRCNNPNCRVFMYYGGRGISYTPEWERYKPFYDWAIANGYDEHAKRGECTLDRIDVNGDYTPLNCRWITQSEQALNTRTNKFIEAFGESHTITEWAKMTGFLAETIRKRLNIGFSQEDAVSSPLGEHRKKIVEFNGERHTTCEWSILLGFSKNLIDYRLKKGWSIEKALTTPRIRNRKRTLA